MDDFEKVYSVYKEILTYLHDWVCSKDGFYRPISIQAVEVAIVSILSENNWNIEKSIKYFKDNVYTGKQKFDDDPVLCTPKLKAFYGELYKRHAAGVKKFENKYKFIINK